MKLSITCAAALGLLISASSFAAAPPDAPAGTTGLCKDGSYASAAERKGSCRGHKGVKEWYADSGAAGTPAAAKTVTPMSAAATAPAPGAMAAASAPTKMARKTAGSNTPSATPAPGGGPGMVWANDTSKVYHCADDKWYGKTKHGEYLSEADAKAKGFRAEHGKACTG